jgi:hypothetical protein
MGTCARICAKFKATKIKRKSEAWNILRATNEQTLWALMKGKLIPLRLSELLGAFTDNFSSYD